MSFYWLQELGSNLIKNLLNCLTYSQIPLLDDPVHLHNKIGKEKKEKKKPWTIPSKVVLLFLTGKCWN
jgi:hypothetical protein